MIIKRQKEFGNKANKAKRREWEMKGVRNNLAKDPTFSTMEDVSLAVARRSRQEKKLTNKIKGAMENKTERKSTIPDPTINDIRLRNFRSSGRKFATGNIMEDGWDALVENFGLKTSYTLEELEALRKTDPDKFQIVRKRMAEEAAERKKRAEEAFKREQEKAVEKAKKAKEATRREIKRDALKRLKNIKKIEIARTAKKAAPWVIGGTLATGATIAGVKAYKKKKAEKEDK